MHSSTITKIHQIKSSQSPSNSNIQKQQTKQRYYIDFNSRLIIPPKKLSFKPTQSPHHNNTNRNSNFNIPQNTSMANTQTIKQRLQKILQKQHKNNNSYMSHLLQVRQTLTPQNIQKNNKLLGHSQNKSKSLFFRSNLKMNRNKKQLQDLSKRSMLQFQHTKREAFQQSINYQSPSQNIKKFNDDIFIVKELKLQSNKMSMSPMTTQHKRKNDRYNNSDHNTKFINQHNIYPSLNIFKQSILCDSSKQGKGLGHKVLTIFKKYDDEWYKQQQDKLLNTSKQEQQTKIQKRLIKSKITKPKLSIKGKRKQQFFQPWKPSIIDTYLGNNDQDTTF